MFHLTDNVSQYLLDGFTKKSYVIQFGPGIHVYDQKTPKNSILYEMLQCYLIKVIVG